MLSRPKLGVCTWLFEDLPLPEIAKIVAALDYDGVELLADWERYTAVTAKQILSDHNLAVYSLTPPNVDLAHPDTAVRDAAFNSYMKLLDFAAEFGNPLVGVSAFAGRTRPMATLAEEGGWLVTAVQKIADEAQQRQLKLVFAVRNRYETHLINQGADGITLLEKVSRDNIGLLLSAFHMGIEEQDAASAMRQVADRLWLYHMADSNRQAIGRGHTKLGAHLWALEDIGYQGPIIMECVPPLPSPFVPEADRLQVLERFLRDSRSWF